jgi:hypothetical protein
MDWQPLVNCPGPYAYDGRAGRRPNITEAHRATVTYSLSWISAVTADMPAQLYFRRCYGGNATGALIKKAGAFTEYVRTFVDYMAVPPPLVGTSSGATAAPAGGLQPGGAEVAPAKTTRAGLWVKPVAAVGNAESGGDGGDDGGGDSGGGGGGFCALLVVINTQLNTSSPIDVTLSPQTLKNWPSAATATADSLDGGAASGHFVGGVLKGLVIQGEDTAVFQVGDGTTKCVLVRNEAGDNAMADGVVGQ